MTAVIVIGMSMAMASPFENFAASAFATNLCKIWWTQDEERNEEKRMNTINIRKHEPSKQEACLNKK